MQYLGTAAAAAAAAAGAYALAAGHSGVAAGCGAGFCCCVICSFLLKRLARLITEPHLGDPKLAWSRAKARALPGTPAPGAAPAWPCKGGDAGRSGAPGASATRSLEEPAWSYFADAVVYATNVIDAEGNVYFNATSGSVHSLDPSGAERWRYMLKNGSPPCPALLGGVLFTADMKGFCYALQASTGKEIWVRQLCQGTGMDSWAIAAADGLVVYQSNGKAKELGVDWTQYGDIFGVDPTSGEERWRYRAEALLYNCMPTIAAGRIFFTSADADLYCLDAQKGHEVWSLPGYKWDNPKQLDAACVPRSMTSIAIFREERVYSTGNPTNLTGIARAHSAEKGELLWSRDFDMHMGNAAALSDACGVLTLVCGVGHTAPMGKINKIPGCPPYLGTVYGLSAANGDVLWRFDAPPMVKTETFIGLCPGQKLFSLWPRLNLPDSFSMPAIGGDGTVYIGWQGGFIFALDGATGKLLSSYECKEGIQGQPTIGPGKELVIAAGRHVHCFAD